MAIETPPTRRFHRIYPGVPDRSGINPFTKQPITIKGRPELARHCVLAIDGHDVVRTWIWSKAGDPAGESYSDRRAFDDLASAAAYLEECADDLCGDGFHETDALAHPAIPRRDPARAASTPESAQRLARAIVEHCDRRGWFGHDMAFRHARGPLHARERSRFAFPRASEAQLAEAERVLGFALPATLRTLYAEVANGGFGPAYGLVGIGDGAGIDDTPEHVEDRYRAERDDSPRRIESGFEKGDPNWFEPFFDEWPARMLQILHWGCNIWSCVDVRTGRVFRYEWLDGTRVLDCMVPEADSLQTWFERWLSGEEMDTIA
jgi:hypothetical protein